MGQSSEGNNTLSELAGKAGSCLSGRGAEVEDYQHVQRSCITFAPNRMFPLMVGVCGRGGTPAELAPQILLLLACTHPTPTRAQRVWPSSCSCPCLSRVAPVGALPVLARK